VGEIAGLNEIIEKKEAEEKLLETEENHEALKELRSQILKHNSKCKECGRIDKTYKELCYWCFIEKTREIAQGLSSEISNMGRSSLIEVEKIKPTRDKLLELV
jgi:hypothetical protein